VGVAADGDVGALVSPYGQKRWTMLMNSRRPSLMKASSFWNGLRDQIVQTEKAKDEL
jgi:hypothetical protein